MSDLIRVSDIEWHDILVADGNGQYHNEKVAYKSQIDDLPSAQPEPCEDAVSRAEVTLIESRPDAYPEEWNADYERGFGDAITAVLNLPSVTPQPCEDAVSRQTLINVLNTECSWDIYNEYGQTTAMGERVLEVINNLPSVTPQQTMTYPQVDGITPSIFTPQLPECEDAVSRQQAISEAKDMPFVLAYYEGAKADDVIDHWIETTRKQVAEMISELPSVTPQRKGEWVDQRQHTDYRCSICGHDYWDESDFCPSCGADMRKDES